MTGWYTIVAEAFPLHFSFQIVWIDQSFLIYQMPLVEIAHLAVYASVIQQ